MIFILVRFNFVAKSAESSPRAPGEHLLSGWQLAGLALRLGDQVGDPAAVPRELRRIVEARDGSGDLTWNEFMEAARAFRVAQQLVV